MGNWKSWLKAIGLYVGGVLVAQTNNVLVANSTGQHIPITAGTVLLPAAVVAAKGALTYFVGKFSQPAQ